MSSSTSCASITIKDDVSATSSMIAIGCDCPTMVYRDLPAMVEAFTTSSPTIVPQSVALSPTMTPTSSPPSSTPTSANTATSSTPQDSGQKSGLSRDGIMSLRIGLGVGIGVGVSAVLVAVFAWLCPCRPVSERRRMKRVLRPLFSAR
jgi:hypothetical protein